MDILVLVGALSLFGIVIGIICMPILHSNRLRIGVLIVTFLIGYILNIVAPKIIILDMFIIGSIAGFFISFAIGGALTFFICYGYGKSTGIKRVINNSMIAIFVLLMAFRVILGGASLLVWYKLVPFRECRVELDYLSSQIGDYFNANERMPDKHELANMQTTSISSGVLTGFRVLTNNACAFVISNHYVEVLVYTGTNLVTSERVKLDGEGNVDKCIERAYEKALARRVLLKKSTVGKRRGTEE